VESLNATRDPPANQIVVSPKVINSTNINKIKSISHAIEFIIPILPLSVLILLFYIKEPKYTIV
jgi:hypothetical protein